MDNLAKAIQDYGSQIDILIGGGVRSTNISEIKEKTKGTRFHSSAILPYETYANKEEIKNLKKKI